ncbi:MAG TPA: heme-binding protein [Kiritimatiellia bacterium]|nr:heme-binding protein [Kiritimatiellia bacterium]HPS06259.1 heme-binding protein [Kiritimatiellia bacterium]
MSLFTSFNVSTLIVSVFLTGGTTTAYESIYPRTPVGTIEIKTLPARTCLVATAPGEAFEDRGTAFMKLFGYIKEQEVSMSVPVSASVSTNDMVFYVGSNSTKRALLSTADVSVQTLPALTVVSIGLRGSYTRKNYEEGLLKLNRWCARQKEWQTNAVPYVVYWNSPFMPWFLRKSEIHIPVTRVANALPAFYTFPVETIDGIPTNLACYKGQVVLVVNVASKCGFTSQYAGLQKLYETCRKRGLVLLGFPSNDFLGQEPGTNDEIKQFCSLNYGVTFPIFGKIHVKGAEQHPLYAWLTDSNLHPEFGGAISWNFNKFLIDRKGKLIARFGSRTTPDAPKLIEAIEKALEE